MYNIVCKTDLYHASRESGFGKSPTKVMDSFTTLKEANDMLFKYLREDAERYFTNWGLACIYASRPNDASISNAGTNIKGYRYYSRDIYTYYVTNNDAD